MKLLAAAVLGVLVCARPAAFAQSLPTAPAPASAQAPMQPRQVLVMLRLPAPHFRPDASYGGSYPKDGGHAARRRIAAALTQAYGLRLVSDWPMPLIGVDCFVMETPIGVPVDSVLQALARDPRVEWAQAVNEFEGLGAGDPLLPLQPAERDWQLAALHRISTGRNVTVAVIDSAIDTVHPDLRGQVLVRENFVEGAGDAPERHGTAVAGVIAARQGNGAGIAGVAPGARLMALRACWETDGQAARCTSFTLGKALNFALMHEAQVVNLSLGGPPDRLLHALLDAAAARGVLVVGAIDPRRPDGGFPASHPSVVAVAADRMAAGALRERAAVAPGRDIPTSLPGGRWGFVSGSSYAAAHVSGLAALLVELTPGASASTLRQALAGSAPGPLPSLRQARAPTQAASMDACALLARAAGACVCQCPSSPATPIPLVR